MPKIGLIAGNRRFPLILAEAARKKDYSVVAVAIKGETDARLNKLVQSCHWLGLNEFSKVFEIFGKEKVTSIIMAGQISPWRLFRPEVTASPELKDLFDSLKDKRADTIFGAIAQRLEQGGLQVLNSTFFLAEFLPKKGVLTEAQPNFAQWEDIYWGLSIAKEIAYLDIGQTVATKDKVIVAVEALEGTDNLIRRSGRITQRGVIVIKVSKPDQDMRFDVPVVGLVTIKNLIRAKAAGIAIEAEKTLFIDQDRGIKLADKKGIFVVAI